MANGTFPKPRSALQLYDFVDDEVREPLLARGLLPWWTHPHLTIRFFRPLSSLLVYADHKLFGEHPLPMHLHSAVWWAMAVLAARALFKRSFSPRVSLIATIIFALAPCHAMPLAWLANREALVSLTFGTIAIGVYARWRDLGRARDAIVALVLFALALLGGGEYALCFGGYVVAADLVRKEPIAKRVIGWMPFVVPATAYLAVRAHLGYMTAGSGFYTDPLHEPVAFLENVPWRGAALLADGWLTLDAATWGPVWQKAFVGVAVIIAALLVRVAVRRAFSRLEPEPRKIAIWLLGGSLFSLAPVLAVVPSLRLLGVATIGVAAVSAIVIDHAWFPRGEEEKDRPAEITRLAAMMLGFSQLVHGPATTWLNAHQFQTDAEGLAERGAWLRGAIADGKSPDTGVVRGMAAVFFTAFAIDPAGPPPKRWCVLAQTGHVLVLRKDARTFDLVVAPGRSLYPTGDGNLYRSADDPLKKGDTITVPGMTATILEVGERGPRQVRFVFDDPDAYHWVQDARDGMKEAELPKPGFGAPFDP
jgi:hypothetical protein